MSDEIKQEAIIEETEPQGKNQEQIEQPKFNEKSENQNWLKHRLERAKEQGVKQVLTELGVESVDEIKKLYQKLEETTANYEKARETANRATVYEQKLEVLKNGFDEKFVDFVVHELRKSEDFSDSLSKFKIDNPQYLKNQNNGIKFSTSPNFENTVQSKDISKRFNEIVQKRLQKE